MASEPTGLETAVSRSPVVFYAARPSGDPGIIHISANVERVTGYAPTAFLSNSGFWFRKIHPTDRANVERALKTLRKSPTASCQYRFKTADGTYRWFRDEMSLSRTKSGRRHQLTGCMIDITEEKQREAELRETEHEREHLARLFHDTVETLPTPVVLLDKDERVLLCNRAYAEPYGKPPEAMLGSTRLENVREFLPRVLRFDGRLVDDTDKHAKWIIRRLRQIGHKSVEVELKSGEWMLVASRISSDGATVTVRADITSQKKAELALREANEKLRAILDATPAAVAAFGLDRRVLMWTRSAEALYGWREAEVLGREPPMCPSPLRAERQRMIAALFETGEVQVFETKRLRRDGTVFDVQLSYSLLRDTENEVIGYVAVATDISERKHTEAALRESEEHFRSMVESHPLAVSMTDAETGEIIYASPATAKLVDQTWLADELRSVTDYYADPNDRVAFLKELKKTGEVRNYEVRRRRADGSLFWVSVDARMIKYKGRDTIVAGLVDQTERRAREEELRDARETFEDALESLSEGIALYDADDRLVMCNERYRESNRMTIDVLKPGVKWETFIRTGAERGQFVGAIGQIDAWVAARRQDRERLRANQEFQQSDGRWFEFSNRRTRQGGIVVTRTDITHHKEMEQALRESEGLIRRVLEACPVPVEMTRADDGVILYESPASWELFGRGETSGGSPEREPFVNDADRRRYLALLREFGAVDNMEAEMRRGDGSTFPAAVSARLIEYQGHDVIVSTSLDLTERRSVEEEMARQRDALHQSEKLSALGELLAGVAHELNNPLSVVVGQALMLEEAATDSKIAQRAAKIGNAADRCARIVKTFLALARQEPAKKQKVDMNAVIDAALEVTGYSLRASDIELSLRMGRALVPVRGDADQLTQVITNLIVNARHALEGIDAPRQIKISSSLRGKKGDVVVTIHDNGPGIPEEIRSRIFEPFFTTKEVGTGTGVGLAVCHRIIEAHGGAISLEGGPGSGGFFAVALPGSYDGDDEAAEDLQRSPRAVASSALVIDDEVEVAQMLADILETDGHRVVVANSGQAALKEIESGDFDVILSDLRMPEMDGQSLFRILKSRNPDVIERIAFITGDTLSPSARDFLEGSGRPYIEKPITPDDLRSLVERLTRTGE